MSEDKEPMKGVELVELEVTRNNSTSVDAFSIALVVAVFIALGLSVYFYRQAFSGELSVSPDRWSAFGSYIGGLFGPLISFLTLLAILKTIGLQKELLDTQRHEFDEMQRLQAKTLDSQLAQIERSNAEADRRIVEETRLNVLKTLDNYSMALHREYENKRKGLDQLLQWAMDGKASPTRDQIDSVRSKISAYEKRLAALTMLYSDLCFNEFTDVSSIKTHYQSEMERLWGESPVPPEDDIEPQQD